MAKDASDSDWSWQDRKNKLDLHATRLFGMQKYLPGSLVLVYMLILCERNPQATSNPPLGLSVQI